MSRRLDKCDALEICNFHKNVYLALSTSSFLSTHSVDLIGIFRTHLGSIINSCLVKGRDCLGCKQLVELLLNNMFNKAESGTKNVKVVKKSMNAERFGNINISSIFAISTIPNEYIKKDVYEKIESYIEHISSKPAHYTNEVLLMGNNTILRDDFLFDVTLLEKFNPIKLLCSSISEFPFPSNLCEKILEMRLAMNILKSIDKPEYLPFCKKWRIPYSPSQIFTIMDNILDGNDDADTNSNISIPNGSNANINFYDTFLFNGELTSKGQRVLFEAEIASFISSIRDLLPQIARSLTLELLWEKGKYLNSAKVKSLSSIHFIDKIINKVMELFPDPNFDTLCSILTIFSNPVISNNKNNLPTYNINDCQKNLSLSLDINESSDLITKYCESDHKLNNILIRFILSVVPMIHGNNILSSIIGHCFTIISHLSTLTDDDIALFLSDHTDIFVASGIYLDKSVIVGEKREIMLREQQKVRESIGNLLLKAEKYFFALENAISTNITGDTVDVLLKLLRESLVIPLTRKCSTSLLTILTKTVILVEDKATPLPSTAWNCIVNAYLEIHSTSGNGVIPKSIDKLLISISNKRISRPLASLLLPIPLERLKLIKSDPTQQIENSSSEITCALSVLSSQLRQRLDLPVSKILGTLCQIISEMGDLPPNSTMIECIIELAFYPMDQECIEILSNYILSPSSQLRYALSQMISKRRDFLPQLYKYLKILVHDTGPASTPSRNVTIFYRQSKKVSPLDPSDILDINYDHSLKEVMPGMIGKTLAMTYFEGDSTFSELVLIITAKYISSQPIKRIAILYTITYLLENGKYGSPNEKYNPLDIEIILKFLVTVVLQQAKNTAIDELNMALISNSCITNNALCALETLVMSEKIDIQSLNDMIERLSIITRDSTGIAPMIITRSCNLLKAMVLARTKSTNKATSLIQLVNAFLDERHEIEDVWTLFFSKTFACISKFENKQTLMSLFNLCFERMNKLARGEKLEAIIHKSTIMAASFSLSMDPEDLPLSQIIDYIYTNNREERLRSLLFIINLCKVNHFIGGEDIMLTLFDCDMRSRIVEGLFPLMPDSYIPVKNSALELSGIMANYDTKRLFETISSAVFNPESTSKTRLGAIRFADIFGKSIKNLNDPNFNIDFLVEACLDSNCEVRSAAITCLKNLVDNLELRSFPMVEFKNAIIFPTDNNLQKFLEEIQLIHNVQFSLIEPILKRSLRSRTRKVRILTLHYLKSSKLSSIYSLPFHPLLDLDEEEVDLICQVMGQIREQIRSSHYDIIKLYMESTIAKSSTFERFCYSKILSHISDYNDLREWSHNILTTNSPYYKIHGILMLFTNLNPRVFSNDLHNLLEITAGLFNHENDAVRDAAFGLFEKLIFALPDLTKLFINTITTLFDSLTLKTASSRDLALMLIPIILKIDNENPANRTEDYSNDKDILYVNAYLMKFDVSPTVRETAEHIWRRIAPNTKRVLKNILPRLLNTLARLNSCNVVNLCIESIVAMDGDVNFGGDTLIGKMLDHLLENKYIYLLKTTISMSNKSSLEGHMNQICQVLKDSCSSKDSAVSMEALGLLSKWVQTVMDDSLIDLFDAALQDSSSPSFKTIKNLSLDHMKLLNAWKLVKTKAIASHGGFWEVADLVLSKCPQNLPELYNTFFEIIGLYNTNTSGLIHIPIARIFWNFGIRGPEFIFEKHNELPPIIYKSLVNSLIESAPSKTLVIELAPAIISTAISDTNIMQSLFKSTDLPQHQGILIILIAQSLVQEIAENNSLTSTSQFLVPTIISYLTHLTTSNPTSLGLAFNSQVAYSISSIFKNMECKYIQPSALRLCGLIIRAAGDWSHLLYKASLLSSLYHLINLIKNEPNVSMTLRPIIPQLLGLSIKSLGSYTCNERPELPFNPSYPTFTVASDPCGTFPVPSFLPLSGQQYTPTPSPITFVRYSSLALFQLAIPCNLDRFDLAFNELLKIVSPGCSSHSLIALEYLITLRHSEEHISKFKRLYDKNMDDRLNPFYNRVIAAHIKASNNSDAVGRLIKDVFENCPSLESGMTLSQLDPSLLVVHKDKFFAIYKLYATYQGGQSNTVYHCKTIAINMFERAIDPCFGKIAVKLLQIEADYGEQTLSFLQVSTL